MKSVAYSHQNFVKLINLPSPVLTTSVEPSIFSRLHKVSSKTEINNPYVLVKVNAVGLNPVDAKFLYGDKLPSFFKPLIKLFLNNKAKSYL